MLLGSSCFFYGTLMHPKVLQRVIGHGDFTYCPAMLDDHVRLRLRDLDYPGVVRRGGNKVQGVLVHGISDVQLHRLDLFEGEEYERVQVLVRNLETGERLLCYVYIFLNTSVILETLWSFDQFEKEASHKWTDDNSNAEYEMLDDPEGIGRRAQLTDITQTELSAHSQADIVGASGPK